MPDNDPAAASDVKHGFNPVAAPCVPHRELFYADDIESEQAAKRVCSQCPLKVDCLQAGLHERYGVWGGTTPEERRQIRLTQRRDS